MTSRPVIDNLDAWLAVLMEGETPVALGGAATYELRIAPDVFGPLLDAADRQAQARDLAAFTGMADTKPPDPKYGPCAVTVITEMPRGGYELLRDGEPVKRGNLNEKFPAA